MARQTRQADTQVVTQPAGTEQELEIKPEDVIIPASVPDVIIDGLGGVAIVNGILRLGLLTVRQISALENKPALLMRLCMTPQTFVGVYDALTQLMAEFEKNGIVVRTPR